MSSGLRILIIDDSPEEQRVAASLLRLNGYRISVAFNGRDGLRKCLLNPPDLVLLDVRMPDLDGFNVCRLLKADPVSANIPIIFLTAANDPSERVKGLQLGAVDYIAKPFSAEEVLMRVEIHLRLSGKTLCSLVEEEEEEREFEGSAGENLVQAALKIIENHLGDNLSPENLARQVGTHEKRLSRLFRNLLGMPVAAYIRERRLQKAKLLLISSFLDINDISEAVGYRSPCNFSTAFKARFGMSPRQCRTLKEAGLEP